jgi:hypothetical protein
MKQVMYRKDNLIKIKFRPIINNKKYKKMWIKINKNTELTLKQ